MAMLLSSHPPELSPSSRSSSSIRSLRTPPSSLPSVPSGSQDPHHPFANFEPQRQSLLFNTYGHRAHMINATDLDLSEHPQAKRTHLHLPPPYSGHDLMAFFPPAPPPHADNPSARLFLAQERAYFALPGREIIRFDERDPQSTMSTSVKGKGKALSPALSMAPIPHPATTGPGAPPFTGPGVYNPSLPPPPQAGPSHPPAPSRRSSGPRPGTSSGSAPPPPVHQVPAPPPPQMTTIAIPPAQPPPAPQGPFDRTPRSHSHSLPPSGHGHHSHSVPPTPHDARAMQYQMLPPPPPQRNAGSPPGSAGRSHSHHGHGHSHSHSHSHPHTHHAPPPPHRRSSGPSSHPSHSRRSSHDMPMGAPLPMPGPGQAAGLPAPVSAPSPPGSTHGGPVRRERGRTPAGGMSMGEEERRRAGKHTKRVVVRGS